MASCTKQNEALHEPLLECERTMLAAGLRHSRGPWFMVPMHAPKRNEALHEPTIKHAAPTELDEGRGVRGYRHGAPMELFKMVHGNNGLSRRWQRTEPLALGPSPPSDGERETDGSSSVRRCLIRILLLLRRRTG